MPVDLLTQDKLVVDQWDLLQLVLLIDHQDQNIPELAEVLMAAKIVQLQEAKAEILDQMFQAQLTAKIQNKQMEDQIQKSKPEKLIEKCT